MGSYVSQLLLPSSFNPPRPLHVEEGIQVLTMLAQGLDDLSNVNARRVGTFRMDSGTGSLLLPAISLLFLQEESTAPGRFRLYRNEQGRNADFSRPAGVAAPQGVGLCLEDIFVHGMLTIQSIPAPGTSDDNGLVFWTWDGPVGAEITLTFLVFEPTH